MVRRCVVGGCSNTADSEKGVTLHVIPFDKDIRPEAVKRRRKWVAFVKLKRDKWKPSSTSLICSEHFGESDYVRSFSAIVGGPNRFQPCLKRDEIGVIAVPKFQCREETEQFNRSRRMVSFFSPHTNISLF